jgi:integrase
MVIEGVTRSTGVRPRRQAAPAVPELLRRLLAALPPAEKPLGARDRAMLLLGFGSALRRSELVSLTLDDVETVPGPRPAAHHRPLEDRPARRRPARRGARQPGQNARNARI